MIITMGNEDRVEIEHMGVVSLNLCTGHVLNLNNTIYVPSMRSNLIFVLVLDDYGYFFNSNNKKVTLSYDSVVVGFWSFM